MTNHKVIFGDSRKLNLIEDKSVELIVTSPPYWQLKDYGVPNQIGFNDSYENYINNLNLVWMECLRVLKDGCKMCVNIGDQFARSIYYGRYKIIPIRTEIIKFCETIGFDYMGAIIWQKATTMKTTGGANIMGSFPYPRNGILKMDYEFILIFKKNGKPPKPTQQQKKESILTKQEWNEYFSSHWSFAGAKQIDHLAMFPEELPKRLIKMFSFTGETVLDPFLGSGTTVAAAQKLGRNSIGYEINKNYLSIIQKKVDTKNLIDDYQVEYLDDIVPKTQDFNKLPYIFRDPIKMERSEDLKNNNKAKKYQEEQNREYFKVSSILSPEKLMLSDGQTVRLIGIRSNNITEKEAMDFLRKNVYRHKVFFKYDKQKFDEEGNLLCYLYLQNKTFINLHLLKTKSVDLDEKFDYKYLNKFKEAYYG